MFKNKNEIKSKIDNISGKIANPEQDEKEIREIRTQIIGLLENTVKFLNQINEFGLWEKNNMASAMSWLNWNLNKKDITTSWLTICMFKIEKALTDSSQRSPSYPHDKKSR